LLADSPLGREVQRILAEHPDGLKKAILLKRLREQNPFAQESHLDEVLANRDTFVERPGDVWVLAGLLAPEDAPERPDAGQQTVVSGLPDPLPIPDLPLDLSSYVVFDLETTGFNEETDGIIQFAALKVVDGEPTEGCNHFVRPIKGLPLSLQQKLRLDTNPGKLEEIRNAPPIEEQIETFREFLAGLPLVAHNGRFDYKFLAQAYKTHLGRELQNPVIDTMELSLLTLPDVASHKLEDLAQELGIDREMVESDIPPNIFRDMRLDLSGESFHDAGFDILFLYLIFPRSVRAPERPVRLASV